MKQTLTLILLTLIVTISLQGQVQVPNQQRALISKVSATWCPPCGTWGWELYENLYDQNNQEAVFLKLHHSGTLQNAAAGALADNFEHFGQPNFFLDQERQTVSSSTAATFASATRMTVMDIFNQESPVVNSIAYAQVNGQSLDYTIDIEFFEETQGEFYVAAYWVESGIIANQAVRGESEHNQILRASLDGNHFGSQISTGTVAAGERFSLDGSFEIPSEWDPQQMEIVTIVWKLEGETYVYQNSYNNPQWGEIVSSTPDLKDQLSLTATQRGQEIFLAWTNTQSLDNVKLDLLNIDGQVVSTKPIGTIAAGKHESNLQVPQSAAGLYILRLQADQGLLSEKIWLQL